MNWILIGLCVLLAQQKQNMASFYGMANPIQKLQAPVKNINPYIKHWEAAHFDRGILDEAHRVHIKQLRRRRKRDATEIAYGRVNVIKLNFFAHDREFRLVLRQDPTSVFSPDIEIENTLGPIDYDVSRIYTGSLEDDENSHVHAVLTHDNLLDGTIDTATEHFYMEPAHRYSKDLPAVGIHTIVYKLTDVKMDKSPVDSTSSSSSPPSSSSSSSSSVLSHHAEHCASERLRRKHLFGYNSNLVDVHQNQQQQQERWWELPREMTGKNDGGVEINGKINGREDKDVLSKRILLHNRHKRWLPDELPDNRNPPLPLDLEVPYNEEITIVSGLDPRDHSNENTHEDHDEEDPDSGFNSDLYSKSNQNNRNIIVNDYNPNSDFNLRSRFNNRNILVNTFRNNSKNNNNNYNSNDNNNRFYNNGNNNGNTNFNSNNSSSNSNSHDSTSRPSHKTHVEIITKNGATKKPNIIVNNYNPDVILTSQNYHHTNLNLNVRNDLSDYGSASSRSMYERKITCMLYLQADHTFFNKMGSDEASIEAITRHVQRANAIYRNTDFNGDGKPDNITFMIKRIKVHNNNALKDSSYRFPGNYGVEKFLELFSEEDYDAFCLAYMFTYRDFEMGTLGLAWTGDLKNAGGVCEKNGHYRGSLKSLNTGIVTLLNYGKHVPPAVSHVTLAHEIGHNFGSPHDPEQCTPGGEDGNYIMFARATSGDKKNNNKFSPCSLKSIEPVLNAKARSAKGCFTEPQHSICGNGVVEPGEQCDCGWEEDCKDTCCFPMSRHPRADERPCTLTPRALCSPSQGPCCTTDCALKFGNKCRDDNGCRDPSFCDGRMPQCPPSVNKPNKTICNKEFVCYMGECTGSICLAYGLESCQCLPGPSDPKTKSCELCCKVPGEANPCKSSFEWNDPPYDVPDMFAKPGTPCNDYNGYCDVFQKCREVDPSGPLATLRKLLLSEESIATFKNWLETNWYIVAIALAGVVTVLVIVAKLLGKRSNLKLKSVTIIHSATTETVRLPDDNNGVIVHTAVRTKVPFKKKVRGERSKSKATTGGAAGKAANGKHPPTAKGCITHPNVPLAGNNSGGNSKSAAGIISGKVTKRGSELLKRTTGRKKNRVTQEEHPAKSGSSDSKSKKNKKHKEVIDYSGSTNTATHTNTFGRVQKWLLESPLVQQPLSHIEHSSKVRKVISKSQSTPERLVQQSPKKTKSLGNLSNEKVKLQVVYKPPFKFSLKLSKNSAVKTHVIGGGLGKKKRKVRTADKNRVAAAPAAGSSGNKAGGRRAALLIRSNDDDIKTPIIESEPNYETLNPKSKDGPHYENLKQSSSGDMPHTSLEPTCADPSLNHSKGSSSRMNRSASNSQLDRQSSPSKHQASSYSRSNSVSNSSHPNQSQSQVSSRSRRNSGSNSVNLSRNFGSTQNLILSSSSGQGYLTKAAKKRSSLNLKASNSHDLARSSTGANLSSSRRHSGSSANLKRESSGSYQNLKGGASGGNLSRNSSSTNLKSSSLTRGSMSNIPRASLNNSPPITAVTPASSAQAIAVFARQTSLQPQHLHPSKSSPTSANNFSINHSHSTSSFSHVNNTNNQFSPSNNSSHHYLAATAAASTNNLLRPHTAACDENRQFEWPKSLNSNSSNNMSYSNLPGSASTGHGNSSHDQSRRRRNAEEAFTSDLEVMVSDVKNLVS